MHVQISSDVLSGFSQPDPMLLLLLKAGWLKSRGTLVRCLASAHITSYKHPAMWPTPAEINDPVFAGRNNGVQVALSPAGTGF